MRTSRTTAPSRRPSRHAVRSCLSPGSGRWTASRATSGRLRCSPRRPDRHDFEDYRRWAFESAALDLALRQAGRSLGDVVGRAPEPVTFVASGGLGDPPSTARLRSFLAVHPTLRFKLDARPDWTDGDLRRAAGARLRRLDRPQGAVLGDGRRQSARPGPVPPRARGFPRCLDRGSRRSPTRRFPSSSRMPTASPGTPRSTPLRTSRRSAGRLAPSTSSRPASARSSVSSPPTTTARRTGSAPTAAVSGSSRSGAGTSSCSRRSFTPTRRTTSPRAATTRRSPRPTCPRARCPFAARATGFLAV